MKVSIYKNTYDKTGLQIPVANFLKGIGSKWKEIVEQARTIKERNVDEYKEYKTKMFPAVIFSGCFADGQAEDGLIDGTYTGLMIVDIDQFIPDPRAKRVKGQKIPVVDQLTVGIQELKNRLINDCHTYAVFISPSGDGVKVLFKVDTTVEEHKVAFNSVYHYFKRQYGILIDPSGKNINRLCYVSYDPDIYVNDDCEVFCVDNHSEDKNNSLSELNIIHAFNTAVKWTERKDEYYDGNKNNYLYHLSCTMNRLGVLKADCIQLIENNYDTPDDKWHQSVNSAYDKHQHEHGSVELPDENEELLEYCRKVIHNISGKKFHDKDFSSFILFNEYQHWVDSGKTELSKKEFKKKLIEINKEYLATTTGTMQSMDDLANELMESDAQMEFIVTGIPEVDDEPLARLSLGMVFGLVGPEGCFKSVWALQLCILNARAGKKCVYYNMEMSKMQWIILFVSMALEMDIQTEVAEKRMDNVQLGKLLKQANKSVNGNIIVVSQAGKKCEDITTEVNLKGDVSLVVIDGLYHLHDEQGNRIFSAIGNSKDLKETAKDTNSCIIMLAHPKTGADQHDRDQMNQIQGGQAIRGNLDGWFSHSKIIDKQESNEEETVYMKKLFYSRFYHKRQGADADKIIKVTDPVGIQVTEISPKVYSFQKVKREKKYGNN